jgi:hypothetical protein
MSPLPAEPEFTKGRDGGGLSAIEPMSVFRGVQYHRFTCVQCGEEARNTYCEPHRTDMLERRLCWGCNYWRDFVEKESARKASMTIIEGHVYGPGNRTSGAFRGMAGRRFDIEYIASSIYAGQRCTTFDLWSGATIPAPLREQFPDTARFLSGARKADSSGTTCWNPSSHGEEPYPPPSALTPNAALSLSTSGER